MTATNIIRDLTRAKAAFQLRAITAALGINQPQQQPRKGETPGAGFGSHLSHGGSSK